MNMAEQDQFQELTITITSANHGAGKSTLACVIANLLANVGLCDVVIKEGEQQPPEAETEYTVVYNRSIMQLREYLQENGYDEIHNRRITIIERTV